MRRRHKAPGPAAAIAMALAFTPAIAFAQDDESPWPRSGSTSAQLNAVRGVVRELEARVQSMQLTVAGQARWTACLRGVRVSEYGDPDRQFGFLYDERDGTGLGHMPALAVDRKSRPRREDYLFFAMAHTAACTSGAPLPGRTADPAAVASRARADTLRSLERRAKRLKRAVRRLSVAAERFDAWESCASWVPVTEYGDPDGGFGYAFGPIGSTVFGYRPALAIDRSDWDDPDYMFLAFVGGDRPGRTCREEPGEGVD